MDPTLLVLNGASSSGKTSLLHALQTILPGPFLDFGIDKFIWMLPGDYLKPPLWEQIFVYQTAPESPQVVAKISSGPLGNRLISGMHRAAAAMLRSGHHLLMDHVYLESSWLEDSAAIFQDFRAYLIAVDCPLEVLEERERLRKDRTVGQARAQFPVIHTHGIYDLRINTAEQTPSAAAEQIKIFLESGRPARAFKKLSRPGELSQASHCE